MPHHHPGVEGQAALNLQLVSAPRVRSLSLLPSALPTEAHGDILCLELSPKPNFWMLTPPSVSRLPPKAPSFP